MNARHKLGDTIARRENGEAVSENRLLQAELRGRDSHAELVEATRFVAHLAGCDGAILVSQDLVLLGFGVEIRAELREGVKVIEPIDPMGRKGKALDIEQFGMRHRSAVKLVSQKPQYCVLVVSQDGPISTIWSEGDRVLVNRNANLVNLNMPWA